MKYLKVYTDFVEAIAPLGEAEAGRLFMAMLRYAADPTEHPDFRGNEKFIWPTAKLNIDREREFAEKQARNGAKGGRPKTQTNPEKPKLTQKSQKEKKINIKPPISPLKGEWDEVSPELQEALNAFAEMRAKMRKPLTDRAMHMALTKLRELASDERIQIAIVNQSVLNGWQSFYALKPQDKPQGREIEMLKRW